MQPLKTAYKYHLKVSENIVKCKYGHVQFKEKDKIEYYLNIILEEIFNMPKFDLTIMNPPYGDLHLKILQEIKNV